MFSKEIKNEKEYFYINQTHMKKCSNNIIHYNECENAEECIKCENNFYFINNEKKYYNKFYIIIQIYLMSTIYE